MTFSINLDLPILHAQLIHSVALVTQNRDVNIDNLLVKLAEDTYGEVERLILVDCEHSFLAHSPVIEELDEQYALSRWAGFDQCFCREVRGRLLTAELQATCATLATAKVIRQRKPESFPLYPHPAQGLDSQQC